MKTRNKILSVFLSFVLFTTLFTSIVYSEDNLTPEVKVVTFSMDETGYVEVYGYVDDKGQAIDDQITFLLIAGDGSDWPPSNFDNVNNIVAYINQETLSNNNAFLFRFQVADRFLNRTMTLMMGHANTEGAYKQVLEAPEDGAGVKFNNISNGSVIYGLDAYTLDSTNLTATTVADSIIYGGNKIYYKIGNNWYDLLNENAIDNSYLVSENAESVETMEELNLRYYYKFMYRFEFDN